MYLEHFKLTEYPFRLTPDSDFLFMSSAHARAKAYMEYTVWNRDGFVVITGEVGCGKTTLLQKLLSELDENVLVAKVFQTQLDEVEFLQAVLVEFGLNPFNAKKVELIDMLNTFLIENFLKLRQLVLVVDDAHNLSPKVLEELRMMSSLETNKEKLLHIILVGQSELNAMLEEPEMEQLLQRVRLRYHIRPLAEAEVADYIVHRLRVAGAADTALFKPETIPAIYKYTGGVPRLINTLCDTALICAYADGMPNVTAAALNTAVEELQWQPYARRVNAKKRVKKPDGPLPELDGLMRQNAQALQGLGGKLDRLETLAPMLSTIASRLGNIEAFLKIIAEAYAKPENRGDPVQRQRLK
jgi:type II secretory pathway predicted ATPase ExeA